MHLKIASFLAELLEERPTRRMLRRGAPSIGSISFAAELKYESVRTIPSTTDQSLVYRDFCSAASVPRGGKNYTVKTERHREISNIQFFDIKRESF